MVQHESSEKKAELLERIVDHVLENGISQLTLRALATAVGSNNRMLLYYFGSREELVVAALHGAEHRFPGIVGVVDHLGGPDRPLEERLLTVWRTVSDPVNQPFNRLFFEVFGLASFDRERYAALLGDIGTEWVGQVASAYRDEGVPEARAESLAHETVALWRGFQATMLSLGAGEVVERAALDATEALVARVREAAVPAATPAAEATPEATRR